MLVVDPAEKVAQRSAISPLPIVLTPKEYDEVLLAADRHRRAAKPDARSYALVYLLLSTGIKEKRDIGTPARTYRVGCPQRTADLHQVSDSCRIVTKRESWLCPRTGSPPTRSILPSTSEARRKRGMDNPEEKLFPGRRGGWSTCSRTSAKKPG
ncbi:MAG: hypothetical protein MZV64_59850 [Ignavibacteriales bacterium]|nr:hypothetical protein [Ignavibacteriales bacterium]